MIIGNKIYYKKKIYNSLEWAKESIDIAPDGSVFLADIHEYTRGRGGRPWKFDKGQLLITILLKPQIKNDFSLHLNQLNMAITLGVLKPLEKFGVTLKWSNDFFYNDKKVGGIISLVVWKNNKPNGIVFGIGLNVNNHIPKLDHSWYQVESLSHISNKLIDKQLLLNNILESIDIYYKKWIDGKFDEIFEEWKKNQSYLNKYITVHKTDGTLVSGIFVDVLPNGSMVLKNDKGEKIEIPFCMVDNLQ